MSFTLFTDKLIELEISEIPIGEGAEGTVYEVIAPSDWQGYVVKVYKDREKARPRQTKIEYLIQNRPSLKNPYSVIFPEALVYEYGQFAGFIMKKAIGAYDLTSLCTLRNSRRLPESWHSKFDRNARQGMRNRYKVCYNIAAAFQQIHKTGKFSFIDIKPENIKINFEGQVSIVDVDSISIIDGEDLIYPAEKLTHEYSPSESTELDLYKDAISETWDRFSIAVLFYKILFGIHPHAGTCEGPYAQHTSNEQKIVEGLFPLGEKASFFSIIPEPHQKFKESPKSVRKLFFDCFELGHNIPWQRPSAADWCKVLKKAKPKTNLLDAWKSWVLSIPKLSVPSLAQKQAKPQKYRSRALSSRGTIPALIVMGGVLTTTLGIVKFNEAYEMKQLALNYQDLDQHVKLSPYQLKMQYVDQYAYVSHFDDGVAAVLKGNKWGYINLEGNPLTEAKYDDASYNFYEGCAIVKLKNHYGFVNTQGKEIAAIRYDWVERFHQGLALVNRNAQYYFIDKQGKEVFQLNYDKVGKFFQGLAVYQTKGRYGFISTKGKEVIPAKYEEAYPFHEGLAVVKYQGKYGYIDLSGKVVIPFYYDTAFSFSNGEAMVSLDGQSWIISKTGDLIRFEN